MHIRGSNCGLAICKSNLLKQKKNNNQCKGILNKFNLVLIATFL